MNKEWNPVAGLSEIKAEDIREGDVLIARHQDGKTYSQLTVTSPEFLMFSGRTHYLLSREITEPTHRGDLVEIYRPNPEGEETEEVEVYVRARHKFQDEFLGGDEAWTDSANDLTKSWVEIMRWVEMVPEFSLRTYTATYKEN